MLNEEFINVWVLFKNLEPLAKQATDSEVRKWAARLRDDYTYPVDSIIYAPDGQKRANVPANELSRRGDGNEAYLRFLRQGLDARVVVATGKDSLPWIAALFLTVLLVSYALSRRVL